MIIFTVLPDLLDLANSRRLERSFDAAHRLVHAELQAASGP